MFASFIVPVIGWWGTLESDAEVNGSRWGHDRGRTREHVWWMPIGPWTLTIYGRGQSYRKLTGLPRTSIDYILDEFDASFNNLAAASLRFHLDFSVCDNEDRRAHYEDLITRLTERDPIFTDEEMAILRPPGWKREDDYELMPNGSYRMRPSTPEEKAVYAASDERTAAYNERIRQARHDFVDIMPELWS
ncbi:hypothetical protein [Nocardia sp. NPDC051833]|uniref:hypothetical protein n=1 Tax=Nocardia sp. NPDC051833 TaxID=3155674 RepID=UPI0034270AAC